MKKTAAKLLREPLIHFLGGALLIFAFFWATGLDRDRADHVIRIDERDIGRMRARWMQNWRRAPTRQELDGLIDQRVREEIYYREALRLGMDADDPVIRRRLANKMKFLNSEDMADKSPSDAVLQNWLDSHPQKYALPARYDFEQVYLGIAGKANRERAPMWIAKLNDSESAPRNIGPPLSLPAHLSGVSGQEIARHFGEKFAAALPALESGKWTGPMESGFGLHLVRISAKIEGKPAKLDQVRRAVTNDWRAARVKAGEEKAYKQLRRRYDVRIAGRK